MYEFIKTNIFPYVYDFLIGLALYAFAYFMARRHHKVKGEHLTKYQKKLDTLHKNYHEYLNLVIEYHRLVTELGKLIQVDHCKYCVDHRIKNLSRVKHDIDTFNFDSEKN